MSEFETLLQQFLATPEKPTTTAVEPQLDLDNKARAYFETILASRTAINGM